MRDFKKKLHLCWYILTDKYTSNRQKCWWLWDWKTKITFSKKEWNKYDKNELFKTIERRKEYK